MAPWLQNTFAKIFMRCLIAIASYCLLSVAPWSAHAASFRVLVYSYTAGFRHASITNGIQTIQMLGATNGFAVDATENPAQFNDANLAQYKAIVFLSTTGDVLTNAQQQAALQHFI